MEGIDLLHMLNAVSGKGEAENVKNFYSKVNKVDMILDLKKFESELRVFKKGDFVTQIIVDKKDPEKYRYTFPKPGYPSIVLDFGKYGEFGSGSERSSCENMVVGSMTPTGIHIYTVESYFFTPYYAEGEPEANK